MSTLERTKCGEIPQILNGNMTSQRRVYEDNDLVQIICNKGYNPQINLLACREGHRSSDGHSYENICKCETFSFFFLCQM